MDQSITTSFPFQSKYLEVHGSKIHYIDEGDATSIQLK
jgi:hypothetical protein